MGHCFLRVMLLSIVVFEKRSALGWRYLCTAVYSAAFDSYISFKEHSLCTAAADERHGWCRSRHSAWVATNWCRRWTWHSGMLFHRYSKLLNIKYSSLELSAFATNLTSLIYLFFLIGKNFLWEIKIRLSQRLFWVPDPSTAHCSGPVLLVCTTYLRIFTMLHYASNKCVMICLIEKPWRAICVIFSCFILCIHLCLSIRLLCIKFFLFQAVRFWEKKLSICWHDWVSEVPKVNWCDFSIRMFEIAKWDCVDVISSTKNGWSLDSHPTFVFRCLFCWRCFIMGAFRWWLWSSCVCCCWWAIILIAASRVALRERSYLRCVRYSWTKVLRKMCSRWGYFYFL